MTYIILSSKAEKTVKQNNYWKRYVLSFDLKKALDLLSLIESGMGFQRVGAENANERSAYFVRVSFFTGICNSFWEEDLSARDGLYSGMISEI